MKIFIATVGLLLSVSSFASVLDEAVEECSLVAEHKLLEKASFFHADLQTTSIRKLDDKVELLKGNYVIWFRAEAYTPSGKIIQLSMITEKPVLPIIRPCF